MDNNILLSVVVLVYGHENYIRQALDSILVQEVNFNYEIIIGEDFSPDNTREILLEYKEKYPDIITLILRDQNIGATKNYFDVCMHSKGKYIANLEGDDYWIDTKKLQKQVDFLEKNKDFIAVSHVLESRTEDNIILKKLPSWIKCDTQTTIKEFLKLNYFAYSSLVYYNIYKDNKNLIEIEKLITTSRNVADLSLCMYLLDNGKVYVMSDVMSIYRVIRSGKALNYNSIKNPLQKSYDHIEVLNANYQYYNKKYNLFELFNHHIIVAFIYVICLRRAKGSEFFKIFKKTPTEYKFKFWILVPISIGKFVFRKIFR